MGRVVKTGGGAAAEPPESEARRLLEAARAEAAALVEAARIDAEALRANARQAARREVEAAAERERERVREEAGPELLRLALAVAGKVLGRAVETEPVAVETAARALERVRHHRRVDLRAHPADAPALRQAAPRLRALVPQAEAFAVREDAGAGRGGVRIETEGATIDGSIEGQLAAVAGAWGLAR
jgi:flagellar biosynthesis/type III secretory pathway protein FliH